MELRKVLTLRGPNIWGLNPAHEAWLFGATSVTDQGLRQVSDALRVLCEQLYGSCDIGCTRPDEPQPLHAETDMARVVGRVAAELQRWLGGRVVTPIVHWLAEENIHQVVVPYDDERTGRACLDWAFEFCSAVVKGDEFAVEAKLETLCDEVAAWRLTPGLNAVLQAAAVRGVPVAKTPASEVWQLGWGVRQHRIHGTITDRTSAVADAFLHDPNVTWKMLQSAGVPMFDPDEEVPPADCRVLIAHHRWVAAVRQDGVDAAGQPHFVELTGAVSAELVTQLVEGTRMLGLDVAEFSLKMPDLSAALDGAERAVVSVSARPDLGAFCAVSQELARRVGQAIVDGLFPNNQSGRIPVIAITGTNGKTTTTRLCAHIVTLAGKRVGMTCTDGIYVAGRRIDTDDCSGPRSARSVLLNPSLDAAVLETARGGMLREGLAFDRCDVAIVTNIGEGDHLGLNGVHTKEQLSRVKRTIVTAVGPHGTAVLKADDPLTAAMANHCPGSVIFFCLDGNHPILVEHRARGGRAAFVRDQSVMLAEGAMEFPLLSLDRIPLTHAGRILFQVENVLASTAANWALGIPAEVIRHGLESFAANVDKSPGRFNLLEINGATVVVDYGHNTSSLQAMLQTLALFPHGRRLAVYSAAGDRRDADMVQQGQMLGQAFDQVVLYEDQYMRGREPGQIMALFEQGLKTGGRVQQILPVQGWGKAVEYILATMKSGDLVLLQADTIDEAVEVVKQLIATQNATREINLKDALRGNNPRGTRV